MMDKIKDEGIEALSRKFLSLPAMGINREVTIKLQNTLKHWNNYQKFSNRYREVFTGLGKEALDRLQDKILEKAEREEKISSLRAIYNMWIDANEEVFAEYVSSEDYSTLYANLVNSLIEFRKHSNILSDGMLTVLNVPTSSGVKSLTERQHHIKKELKETARMQRRTLDALEEIRNELKKLSETKNKTKTTKKNIKVNSGKKIAKKKSTGTASKQTKKAKKTQARKKS
jgi:class III poly(R)-hydroxyalkanoic acid synthase PhaE subunit